MIIEKSWFSKGTLLLLQGFKKGNDFVLKSYKDSIYPVISKIINIDVDKKPIFQFERCKLE